VLLCLFAFKFPLCLAGLIAIGSVKITGMWFLVQLSRDANLNGTLAMVSSSGSPKVLSGAKASGRPFFSYLFFGRAKKRYSPSGEI